MRTEPRFAFRYTSGDNLTVVSSFAKYLKRFDDGVKAVNGSTLLKQSMSRFHSSVESLISKSTFFGHTTRASDDSMSEATRWAITVTIVLVSALILIFVRNIKVQIDDDASQRARRFSGPRRSVDISEGGSRSPSGSRGRSSSPNRNWSSDSPHGRSSRCDFSPTARSPGSKIPKGQLEVGGAALLYMSYGRMRDSEILADYCSVDDRSIAFQFEEDTIKVLKIAKSKAYQPGKKDKIDNKKRECRLLYVVDDRGEFLASVMMQVNCSEQAAYHALFGFLAAAKSCADEAKTCEKHGLNIRLTGIMEELCAGCDNSQKLVAFKPKTSRDRGSAGAANVLEKMEDVKKSIRQGVAAAQENEAALGNLQKSSRNMEQAAQAFENTSKVALWKHQLDRYKWYIFIVVVITDVFLIWLVWSL